MTYADLNQCKGCACFTDKSHGGLVNGLCLDCRNPEVPEVTESCSSAGADAQVGQQSHLKTARADRAEVATGLHDLYQRTPQQEQELEIMRSRGEI